MINILLYSILLLISSHEIKQASSENLNQERFIELEKIAKGYTTFAVKERPLIFRKALSENCFEGMSGEKLLVERFRPEMTDSLTKVLQDLIQNPDTTLWKPKDFQWNYVFSDSDEYVGIERYAINYWSSNDSATFNELKSRLFDWEKKDWFNRPISAISHPLMTTDGNYGLIEYAKSFGGGRSGYGGILLFRFDNGRWIHIAKLSTWMS